MPGIGLSWGHRALVAPETCDALQSAWPNTLQTQGPWPWAPSPRSYSAWVPSAAVESGAEEFGTAVASGGARKDFLEETRRLKTRYEGKNEGRHQRRPFMGWPRVGPPLRFPIVRSNSSHDFSWREEATVAAWASWPGGFHFSWEPRRQQLFRGADACLFGSWPLECASRADSLT